MGTKSKSFALVLVTLFLTSIVILPPVNSQSYLPQITITANGSVIGTDRIHQSGNIYTLTGNLNALIIIEKDNIVLNGGGFILQGTGNLKKDETGVSLSGLTNIKIENLTINGFNHAIELYNSSHCTISRNTIRGGNLGVYMSRSIDNWVNQNKIRNTEQDAIYLWSSSSNILSENVVVDNLGTGINVDDINGGNASANIISNNDFKNNSRYNLGFGDIGILSSNNIIIGNTITNSTGIHIFLHHASGNLLTKNSISNSSLAFSCIEADQNNTFWENSIIGNKVAVLYGGIINDTLYRNNFINNTMIHGLPAYGNPASPHWDNGTFGNYYSDYLTKHSAAKETDNTGTYDTPYEIYVYDTYLVPQTYVYYDNHPLVNPVNFSQSSAVVPWWVTPTPTNQSVTDSYVVVIVIVLVLAVALGSLLLYRRHRKTALVKKP